VALSADRVMLRANGDKAWFGWPTDDKLEELRMDQRLVALPSSGGAA
jgi:hypothetical protein